MKALGNLEFNKSPSYFMHIDLNSCFATVEQQANPLLRDKPIAVAAYDTPNGVILAASVTAKEYGIKTGWKVKDAREVCPKIIVLPPDPNKYRHVHRELDKLLAQYTSTYKSKSIDEFVLNFEGHTKINKDLITVGKEIKQRIKKEIGDYITVSIGISKNQFLAKTASNLKKPDGLEEINEHNYLDVYERLELTDLTGIANRTAIKLNNYGIHTVMDLYNCTSNDLKSAFKSVVGSYWYLKLRGYEVETYKDERKTFGHEYSLPKPLKKLNEVTPILTKLVEKLGYRMRNKGYKAQGVNLYARYDDGTSWHMAKTTKKVMFDSRDIYKEVLDLYLKSPQKGLKMLGVSCFNLSKSSQLQLELFDDAEKSEKLTKALDSINNKWGKFVITPASMVSKDKYVPDRIGFGNID